MFRGRHIHQMDSKGRLSIPSKFRDILSSSHDDSLIITNFDKCLWAYPTEEWDALERKVATFPQFKDEVKALQRMFISAACECPIDAQGRILIPASLREYAEIEKDVIIVGMTRRLEIWARKHWDDAFEDARKRLEDMGEKLADLGL